MVWSEKERFLFRSDREGLCWGSGLAPWPESSIFSSLYVTSEIISLYIYYPYGSEWWVQYTIRYNKKLCELQSITIKWKPLNLPPNLGTRTFPVLPPCLCASLPFQPCLPTQSWKSSHGLKFHEVYSRAFIFFFFESPCRHPVFSLES